MNFDIKSFSLFLNVLLLAAVLDKNEIANHFLPKNKWCYHIGAPLLTGLSIWILNLYGFKLLNHQLFMIALAISTFVTTLRNKAERNQLQKTLMKRIT